jgi:hypothetical protein
MAGSSRSVRLINRLSVLSEGNFLPDFFLLSANDHQLLATRYSQSRLASDASIELANGELSPERSFDHMP